MFVVITVASKTKRFIYIHILVLVSKFAVMLNLFEYWLVLTTVGTVHFHEKICGGLSYQRF